MRTLTRIAVEALNEQGNLADVRARLHRLAPWYQNQPMETREQILIAIGQYASRDREKFERYIRRNKMQGREYYRHPQLQEPILNLYRRLERLSSQSDCTTQAVEAMVNSVM